MGRIGAVRWSAPFASTEGSRLSKFSELDDYCAVELAVEIIGGKWKLVILDKLTAGPTRFSELRRAMPRITHRVLARALRELEADGVLDRTVYAEVPPRVEYSLTVVGKSLEPLVRQLSDWGQWYQANYDPDAAECCDS